MTALEKKKSLLDLLEKAEETGGIINSFIQFLMYDEWPAHWNLRIVIRTFGQDIPHIEKYLRSFGFKTSTGAIDPEHNQFSLGEETGIPLTNLLDEILSLPKNTIVLLRDYYPFWNGSGSLSKGGKPFPISNRVFTKFLDDNIKGASSENDKDCIRPFDSDTMTFIPPSSSMGYKAVQVNSYEAILYPRYFIEEFEEYTPKIKRLLLRNYISTFSPTPLSEVLIEYFIHTVMDSSQEERSLRELKMQVEKMFFLPCESWSQGKEWDKKSAYIDGNPVHFIEHKVLAQGILPDNLREALARDYGVPIYIWGLGEGNSLVLRSEVRAEEKNTVHLLQTDDNTHFSVLERIPEEGTISNLQSPTHLKTSLIPFWVFLWATLSSSPWGHNN